MELSPPYYILRKKGGAFSATRHYERGPFCGIGVCVYARTMRSHVRNLWAGARAVDRNRHARRSPERSDRASRRFTRGSSLDLKHVLDLMRVGRSSVQMGRARARSPAGDRGESRALQVARRICGAPG
jgi:hypothetical protein